MAVQIRQEQRGDDRAGYDVGYRKPPKEHRFKKGQSGNPSGKKKYRIDTSGMTGLQRFVAKEMRRKVAIREGGTVRKVMQQEVIAKQLVATMVSGSPVDRLRAIRALKELRAIEALGDAELKMQWQIEEEDDRDDEKAWHDFEREMEAFVAEGIEEAEYRSNEAQSGQDYAWDPGGDGEGRLDRRDADSCVSRAASEHGTDRGDDRVQNRSDPHNLNNDRPTPDDRASRHERDSPDPMDLAHDRLDAWPQAPPRGR